MFAEDFCADLVAESALIPPYPTPSGIMASLSEPYSVLRAVA